MNSSKCVQSYNQHSNQSVKPINLLVSLHSESFALASEMCILSLLFRHLQNYMVESESENVSPSSHVQLSATPWTVAHQAPLSMGFPKQEYWSGLPFPSPGDLPNLGIRTRVS